jgi:hypothetical protein
MIQHGAFPSEIGNPPIREVQPKAIAVSLRAHCPERHIWTEVQNIIRLLQIRD